jgi:phage shock protein PspC (stress-responsive transcriptional regulator)
MSDVNGGTSGSGGLGGSDGQDDPGGPGSGGQGSGGQGSGGQGSGGPGSGGQGSGGPGSRGPGAGKRLERKLSDRWVAGVCAGLADYFGQDVTLIRVIFIVLTLFGGFGLVGYVVAWALVPEEGEPVSIAEKVVNKSGV